MQYEEVMEYLKMAEKYAGAMELDAITNLLEMLGNPQKKLKFIHVGGTNGKGSIAAYISTILAKAGYKVGRYVSPTIREYRERIQMLYCEKENYIQQYISKENVCKWIEIIQSVCEEIERKKGIHPTPFEIETAMCFLECVEQACDIVVLEVGMGGKHDATNIIDTVICSVFASISMDHMEYLGETLSEIAREKVGIIKEFGTVAAYDYSSWSKESGVKDEISPILNQEIKEKKGELVYADFQKIKNCKHRMNGIVFDYQEYKGIKTNLLGVNQPRNIAVAIEAIELLIKKGWKVEEEDIREGILAAKWEGRFEVLKKNPYFIVDGAHNPDAARCLRETLDLYLPNKKILYIMGVLADKDYPKILSYLGERAEKIITITPNNKRALDGKDLKREAEKYCSQVENGETVERALKIAEQEKDNYDAIVYFGSLYSLHQVYDFLE